MAHEPRTVPRILINWVVVAAHGSRLTAQEPRLTKRIPHSYAIRRTTSRAHPHTVGPPPTPVRPPAPHTARRSLPRRTLRVALSRAPSRARSRRTGLPRALRRPHTSPVPRIARSHPHTQRHVPALAQVQRACALFAAVTARTRSRAGTTGLRFVRSRHRTHLTCTTPPTLSTSAVPKHSSSTMT